jgi:hypothetical protein
MSSTTYRIDFAEIKRAVAMPAVAQFLNLAGLKPRGAHQLRGPCPFCKNPESFVVSSDGGKDKTGAFFCFKCDAGGDQLELVSLARGHGRRDRQGALDAAKELHAAFIAKEDVGEARKPRDRSDASPQPLAGKRQGFDPDAYAKTLDPEHEALADLGLDPETLRDWKAGYASSGVHRGRLALAVTARDGAVAGYVGRAIKPEASPRLLAPNGLAPEKFIFGADRVTSGQLFLARDPLDVLKAAQSGVGNVVAVLTEDIAGIQLESLAALMDERKCESMAFF